MNGKHFDVKDMEREYKRGRVEELKELYDWIDKEENKLDKKNNLDFLCFSIGERIQKRLLELQGVEKQK